MEAETETLRLEVWAQNEARCPKRGTERHRDISYTMLDVVRRSHVTSDQATHWGCPRVARQLAKPGK